MQRTAERLHEGGVGDGSGCGQVDRTLDVGGEEPLDGGDVVVDVDPADELAAAAAAPAAEAIKIASGTYKLDPSHTDVLAQWSHFGFSNPFANFGNVEGTLVYDADNVGASSVQVTLPLSGLEAFTPKFNEHLRSADFFDAATFPNATFKSTRVEAAGAGKLKVSGDMGVAMRLQRVI